MATSEEQALQVKLAANRELVVELEADNTRLRAELAFLRLIVTEKFARDVEVTGSDTP